MKRRHFWANAQLIPMLIPMLISVVVGAIVLSDGFASLVPETWEGHATLIIQVATLVAGVASVVYVVTRPRRS